MPIENVPSDPLSFDLLQVKLCTHCHRPLTNDLSPHRTPALSQVSTPSDTLLICTSCQDKSAREPSLDSPSSALVTLVDMDVDSAPVPGVNGISPSADVDANSPPTDKSPLASGSHVSHDRSFTVYRDEAQVPTAIPPIRPDNSSNPVLQPRRQSFTLPSQSTHTIVQPPAAWAKPVFRSTSSAPSLISSSRPAAQLAQAVFSPDPLVDITRLRVPSHSYGCLYPGAIFQGTQKSGKNRYAVTVTIVDVDFASSFLCGYLRISGLTDDWPELTTYFDAEIIGSRYGFLTRAWGATEQEDMVHWKKFHPFNRVQHELQKPDLTMKEQDHGAVFMRWKERFLVPDHRIQDINGASFAGFYYVCVDFNPPRPTSPTSTSFRTSDLPPCFEDSPSLSSVAATSPPKAEFPLPIRRGSSSHGRKARRSKSPARYHFEEPVPTMCGYYYHQNSEPYQELSLTHVKEQSTTSFEFR